MPPLKGILPQEWQDRSEKWAKAVWENKKNRPDAFRYDRPEARMDWRVNWWARQGECWVCLFLQKDPGLLDWNEHHPDDGCDILYSPLILQVKATRTFDPPYLMWPVTKNHLWKDARFDIMIGVASANYPEHEIFGWTWKHVFERLRHVAKGHRFNTQYGNRTDAGLVDGTWYMEPDELWPMSDFYAETNLWRRIEA
jgi:hypothetical protein